jgi:hypothetical protein
MAYRLIAFTFALLLAIVGLIQGALPHLWFGWVCAAILIFLLEK